MVDTISLKRSIIGHLVNFIGWKTNRKIIVFLSDDWGSIRTSSYQSLLDLENARINMSFRFDKYDSLETSNDLSGLFEVLNSVKDINGKSAVFTAYSIVTNPDFKQILKDKGEKYSSIALPDLLNNLPGHEGTWELWKEGIEKGFFIPEFHGREHMNVKMLLDNIKFNDPEFISNFKNQSFSGISKDDAYSTFYYKKNSEIEYLKNSISEGIKLFSEIFGYSPEHFTAPTGVYSKLLDKTLFDNGIKFLDAPLIGKEPIGEGNHKTNFSYLGKKNSLGQMSILRNCMFENNSTPDWVDFCLLGIDAAFRMKAPAIISTHRVNFSGNIFPHNRDKGLKALSSLLKNITHRWPDVEFMSVRELGNLMKS